MKSIAEYFKGEYDSLKVLKEDYETFIEWMKNPSSNPNREVNEGIIRDTLLNSEDTEDGICELEVLLKDTKNQLEIITPLYEMTKEFA